MEGIRPTISLMRTTFGAEESEERNEDHLERGLAGDQVGFDVCAAFGKDERFAHGLEQIVGEQEQEDVEGQAQGAPTLGPHVGEEAESFPAGLLGGSPRVLKEGIPGAFE